MKFIEITYVGGAIIFTHIDDPEKYSAFVEELTASEVWDGVRKDKSNPTGIVSGGCVTDGRREGCRLKVLIPVDVPAHGRILGYLTARDDVARADTVPAV